MSDDLSDDPFADPNAGGEEIAAMDQSSIDGLLGLNTFGMNEKGGVEVLYDLNNVPQTRNPMLEAIFERTIRSLKSSLRKIASDQVEVALNAITTTRYRSYMESISLPAVLAVVKAKPWGGYMLMVVSARLVYGLVEATLGGAAKGTNGPIEGRAFTMIETRIARWLIDAMIADAQEAFSTVSPVELELDHTETVPRFINIAPPSSLAVTISVSVQLGDMADNVEMFIPLSTLEPVRELLPNHTMREPNPQDAVWAGELLGEVLRARTELEAVLHEEQFPLKRIMRLGIGDTLLFDRRPDDPIELRCNGTPVAFGRAGRSGDRLAVEVRTCRDQQGGLDSLPHGGLN